MVDLLYITFSSLNVTVSNEEYGKKPSDHD
jgi:hypothetical protein